MDEHPRTANWKAGAKHIHVCKDSGARCRRGSWTCAGMEREQRGPLSRVVEFVGQRLESADCAARIYHCWRFGARAVVWQIHGRPALRSDRLDERDVYRQRSARTGKKSLPRIAVRLRHRRHPLRPR